MSVSEKMSGGGEAAFVKAYERLNAEQKRAVDTIEGPVMVIAGPGTGKTQILTLRIANILRQTDTKPENILALTFTNAGAKAMRERLTSFIGATAYRVPIYTFHSFAETLIRRFPEAYPKIIGGRPASDLEVLELIESIIDDPALTALRPHGRPEYYLRQIISALGDLKKESYSPDDFAKFVGKQEESLLGIEQYHTKGAHKGKVRGEYKDAEKYLLRNRALLTVYRRYEALMRERGLYDYNDMVFETVQALSLNEDMRLSVQETYQYLLADEHQDVSGSQNRILELIAAYHERPNIFVVGDEKQAIYRFQGASLENFLHFQKLYPEVEVISLTQNYRSSQAILDVAQAIITTDDEALRSLRIPLLAATTDGAVIEQRTFTHQAFEDAWLVETVRAQLASGIAPEEVAIIVRTNRQVERYAELVRGAGIAVAPSADSDMLAHPLMRTVRLLLTAVAEPGNDAVFAELLHEPYWGITPAALGTVLATRSYAQSLLALCGDTEALTELGVESQPFTRVLQVLKEARELGLSVPPQRVLAYLVEESGLLGHVVARDPSMGGRVLRRLYDEVEALTLRDQSLTVAGVVRALSLRIVHNLPLSAPLIPLEAGAVPILTAHKSKGLEYEVVIMPELTDGVWDGSVRSSSFVLPAGTGVSDDPQVAADDETRLFYVALTRAKRTLLLSGAAESADGRVRVAARVRTELPQSLVPEVATPLPAVEATVAVFTQTKAPALPLAVIQHALVTRGFSATSLNNYLKSPWTYIYRNVLRIPAPKTVELQFGTAVHAVIDSAVRTHARTGAWPRTTEVAEELKRALGRLPLSVSEFTRLHERALSALTIYVPHLADIQAAEQRTEASFTATIPLSLPELPALTLTGKLDRLDFASDGTLVRVTDYKTGKAKTRGVIEGTTKDADGGYKRQLVFYALLLSLQDDERLHCRTMVLSFVEPQSGVIKEEVFTITNEEIEALKQEIARVAGEIMSGACLLTVCDPEVCDYCELVEALYELS